MFYTTGDLPFQDDVRDYLFNDWVKQKGHGFIGAHSAADTYHNYEPYWEMLGGTFNGHPWNSNEKVTVTRARHRITRSASRGATSSRSPTRSISSSTGSQRRCTC